ncbi:MAG: glycerophosphodiester phosphodiesterase family protein [Chloroflexota bacterium]
MLPPIDVPPNFRIIAHRGASAYRPENTRSAFDLAVMMGVTEIETDTQLTIDGQVVLCHDTSLARYGYPHHQPESMVWADLAEFDFGSWFSPYSFTGERMITLANLFETYGSQFTYHIELKGQAPNLPQQVHQTISRFQLADYCIITSFSFEMLTKMRQVAPSYRLGWLVQDISDTVLQEAESLKLFQLCPLANRVDADLVQKAKLIVSEVRAWGMRGTPQEVRGLISRIVEAGCDGMTIDWPDWATNQAE